MARRGAFHGLDYSFGRPPGTIPLSDKVRTQRLKQEATQLVALGGISGLTLRHVVGSVVLCEDDSLCLGKERP